MDPRPALEGKSIAQLVAFFGDGALTEASTCSTSFEAILKLLRLKSSPSMRAFALSKNLRRAVLFCKIS